jgi:hypothetical protein
VTGLGYARSGAGGLDEQQTLSGEQSPTGAMKENTSGIREEEKRLDSQDLLGAGHSTGPKGRHGWRHESRHNTTALKSNTGDKSCAVCSCSKEDVCGDPAPQWDEEPKRETEMHTGTWTENHKINCGKSKL